MNKFLRLTVFRAAFSSIVNRATTYLKPTSFKVSLITSFVIVFLYFWQVIAQQEEPLFLAMLNQRITDQISKHLPVNQTHNNEIVNILIDNYSAHHARSSIFQQLLFELNEYYGARVIGVNLLLSTSQCLQQIHTFPAIEHSANTQPLTDDQKKLIKQLQDPGYTSLQTKKDLRQWDNVILGYPFYFNQDNLEYLNSMHFTNIARRLQNNNYKTLFNQQILQNNNQILQATSAEVHLGYFPKNYTLSGATNLLPDASDGLVRRGALVFKYQLDFYPSLAVQVLRRYLQTPSEPLPDLQIFFNHLGISEIAIGAQKFATNLDGSINISFKGPPKSFPYYSAFDVLQRSVPIKELKNKIILIDTTSNYFPKIQNASAGPDFPQVEIQANLIENLLNQRYITKNLLVDCVGLMTLIFVAGLLAWIQRLRSFCFFMISITILFFYLYFDFWLAQTYHVSINFVYSAMLVLLNVAFVHIFKYSIEEKRYLKGIFERFEDPEVIKQMIDNPKNLQLGGTRKNLTIFFTDIENFTAISEKLEPEVLLEQIDEYIYSMSTIITQKHGTLNKFEGDSIMGYFGAPLPNPSQTRDACSCVLNMQKRLKQMRYLWQQQQRPLFYMRAGINYGEVIIGNMGSKYRMEHTVLGSSVNITARLESANKIFGTEVIISSSTYSQIQHEFTCRPLGWLTLLGRQKPIEIYELLGEKDEFTDRQYIALDFYETALKSYQQKDWIQAKQAFEESAQIWGCDHLLSFFLNRIKWFEENPESAEQWDGIEKMLQK